MLDIDSFHWTDEILEKGLPCGSEKFIRRLEKTAGRILHYRPMGMPKKNRSALKRGKRCASPFYLNLER